MLLGEKIKAAVEASDFSAEMVANYIGISSVNLYRLYKKDSFEIKYLIKISELLKVPLSQFLPEENANVPSGPVNQHGLINTLGNIKKQSIKSNSGNAESDYLPSQVDEEKLLQQIESLHAEIKSLQKEVALKDQIINLKDQLIEQFKK
ncbi:hypothetical protein HUW51_16965 [Adhaeribacter swui]|uniref:Uncharacterized protein n=1 Tax=Adhaeribacter swui TaxID=2086471 RepID=A0A7G7GAZ6_9BACT|nr:hypothetical protein [Adhaeribacter swui]QNF34330.1 hypothetical protein HUW51_16965 [Adhaeribacter swui]